MVAQRQEKSQTGLERDLCQIYQAVEAAIVRALAEEAVDLVETLEGSEGSEHLMQVLKATERCETLEIGNAEVLCLQCHNRTERLAMVAVHEPTMVPRVRASETVDRLQPLGVRDVPLLARKTEVLGRRDANFKSGR